MFKEIKLAFYIITISLFLFLTSKYYFSDANIKNYFRKINNIDQSIKDIGEKLIVLESDTENIIQDVDKNNDTNKKTKNFSFWELLNNND